MPTRRRQSAEPAETMANTFVVRACALALVFIAQPSSSAPLLHQFFDAIDRDGDSLVSEHELLRYLVEHGAAHDTCAHKHGQGHGAGHERDQERHGWPRMSLIRRHALQHVMSTLGSGFSGRDGDAVGTVPVVDLAGAAASAAADSARRTRPCEPQQVSLALTGNAREMRDLVTQLAVPNPRVTVPQLLPSASAPAASAAAPR